MAEPGANYDAFYVDLGSRIKEARRRLGITQSELAAAFSLSRSSVANLESGRQHPPVHIIVEMASLLQFEVPGIVINDRPAMLVLRAHERTRRSLARSWQALEAVIALAHDARWPPAGVDGEAEHG